MLLALEPASVGERLLATLLDGTLVVAYLFLGALALGEFTDGSTAAVVLYLLPVLVYHLAFEVLLDGRTPGKLALRLRVARLDGAQPSLGQYVLRWLLRFVDVTLSSGSVALLSIVVTRRAQRLGDLAAGTTVVRRRQRVRLGEVLYPAAPPGHVPDFPEAERLSDADVRTLRAVLVRLRSTRRDRQATVLAKRAKAAVEARLGMAPVPMPPEAFLRAVVRDHTVVLDQYGTPVHSSTVDGSRLEAVPAESDR